MALVVEQPAISETAFSGVESLVQVLTYLRDCRRRADREEFERTLLGLGMPKSEARSYWDALSPVPTCLLGSVREAVRDGDRERFCKLLREYGVDDGEHEKWWDEFETRVAVADMSWDGVKSNTGLVSWAHIWEQSGNRPRNWLLYRIVELMFPDLLIVRQTNDSHPGRISDATPPFMIIDKPIVRGEPIDNNGKTDYGALAVWAFAKGERPSAFSAAIMRAAGPLVSTLGSTDGLKLAKVLVDNQMYIPPEIVCQILADRIETGRRGEKVVLVGAFCPDYAYERTDNPQVPYRYTFEDVGNGVGLVAQQFLRIVPPLSQLLSRMSIDHEVVLGIGDFEADSEQILQQVGVGRGEFLERCRQSLVAFQEQIPDWVPLTLEMCDEHRCDGRLRPYAAEAEERMLRRDFGCMPHVYSDHEAVIAGIPQDYRTFYERWYGVEGMSEQDVFGHVIRQGAEYAALARIYQEDFADAHVIHLAGDRPAMNRFNCHHQPVCTLCAKRAY